VVDEKHRNITVTYDGWVKSKDAWHWKHADPENWPLKQHLRPRSKPRAYRKDVEYVIKTAKSSSSTNLGAMIPGRRWSDGLHQAMNQGRLQDRTRDQTLGRSLSELFPLFKRAA